MMAMILAAGRGERMRPLTDHTPKPLLQVGGKPLIVWHIERLVAAGITELIINHAHLGAQIEQVLGDGKQFGATIQYSPEATALETAGGIANALHLLTNSPHPLSKAPSLRSPPQQAGERANEKDNFEYFAVVNGDVYCDYDFTQLASHAAQMQANNDLAHLVLVNNPPQHPNGDFALDESRVATLPPFTQQLGAQPLSCAGNAPAASPLPLPSSYTFSGIGLYHPSLFSDIARGTKAPLAPLLRAQIALKKVSGEHHQGAWVDVGTPQRLHELDQQLRTI
jgi:MurNAc alpha-1-phosphate uridylyltransferase